MKFTKMQGCGNDYIYINCFEECVADAPALSRRLSDRHFGIGGDGIVLICPSENADFFMDIYNLDGSRAKMCGNAVRCVGKYVYDHKMTDKTEITVDTLSGVKYLKLIKNADGSCIESVTVDMGCPVTVPGEIPLNTGFLEQYASDGNEVHKNENGAILGMPLTASGDTFGFTFVSMGNPHAVTFVEATDSFCIEKYGPVFEHHEMFPERANIEFVQVIDRRNIKMRVWERGSNETYACGTGACASAYACMLNGFTDNEVRVGMLGGDLIIRYDSDTGRIYMTGPATEVFSGEIK